MSKYNCNYCEDKREIEMDNNGPIRPCPICCRRPNMTAGKTYFIDENVDFGDRNSMSEFRHYTEEKK